jgi:hypothetical protein
MCILKCLMKAIQYQYMAKAESYAMAMKSEEKKRS